MRRICLFAGSSPGARASYRDAAAEFGALLAREGLGLVYGGASVGLMAVAAGGTVIGVTPRALIDQEIAHKGLRSCASSDRCMNARR